VAATQSDFWSFGVLLPNHALFTLSKRDPLAPRCRSDAGGGLVIFVFGGKVLQHHWDAVSALLVTGQYAAV